MRSLVVELVEGPRRPPALGLGAVDAQFHGESTEPQPAPRVVTVVGGVGQGAQFGGERLRLGEHAVHDVAGLGRFEGGDQAQAQGPVGVDVLIVGAGPNRSHPGV